MADVIIGFFGGLVPYVACRWVKAWYGYDDALDVFGVHGVGGTVGLVLVGVLATAAVNPNPSINLRAVVGHSLWREQFKAIAITLALVTAGTAVIALVVRSLYGLRPTIEAETEGLDLSDHGEQAYIFESES